MAVEFWTRRQPVTSYPSKGKGRNNPFSFENFKTFVGGLSLTVAFAFGTRVVAVQTPVLVKGRGRVFVNPVKIHDLTYSTSTGGKEAEFKQERYPPLYGASC